MKKTIVTILFLSGIAVMGVLLSKHAAQENVVTDKLQVTTSFYPLYFFAQQIGGDRANVVSITPAGAEPHDYEPSARDIAQIEKSKLLVLNGGNLEPWGDSIKENLDPAQTKIVVAGDGLANQQLAENGENSVDPHVWLSPPLAEQMVDKITQGFAQIDLVNASYYQNNAIVLKQKLQALDQEYAQGLGRCKQIDIITSHAAFGYLATTYHLHQLPIAGLSPDAEPSQQQIEWLANFAKQNNIQYIFFESLVSPKLSQALAQEIGAQTLVLNPIEGLGQKDLAGGKNYFTEMRQNLTNLELALQCPVGAAQGKQ